MHEPDPPLSFPPLFDLEAERWRWPAPPFAWHHESPPDTDMAQACRVELADGNVAEGDMVEFDVARRSLGFRSRINGVRQPLSFDQVRRLTVVGPLSPVQDSGGKAINLLPLAEHGCDYSLKPKGSALPLSGRTIGHVDSPEGLFLFEPVANDTSLLRVFVSKSANAGCVFGPTALSAATKRWADSPAALVKAIADQRSKPVERLGQAVLSLALLTPQQLERALARKPADQPMGEFLMSAGLISAAQLRAAIAHKMGCPIVDLKRFPIDLNAVAKLPHRLAMSYRVLPLMFDEDRMLLAADEPPSDDKLRSIQVFTNLVPVPVLARPADLRDALADMPSTAWSARVI